MDLADVLKGAIPGCNVIRSDVQGAIPPDIIITCDMMRPVAIKVSYQGDADQDIMPYLG